MGKCTKTYVTNRYANRFALPKANKHTEINTVKKYCTHCKKAGHGRKECWTLHGRPEKSGPSFGFLTLKEAKCMIPEFDGNSRNRVREFINAANYAMKNIHSADKQTLLEAILCTKFKEKAMMDFYTRDVRNYE